MHIQSSQHLSSEMLEEYVMGRLPEPRAASVEEHLLICHACQDELTALDDFVATYAAVASKLEAAPERKQPNPSKEHPWSRLWEAARSLIAVRPTPAWAMAGSCLAMVLLLVPFRPAEVPPQSVTLAANRSSQDFAKASSAAPIFLHLNAAGIPPDTVLAVEVVTSSGTGKQQFPALRQNENVRVVKPVTLSTGKYWIRLRDAANNQLLREFG